MSVIVSNSAESKLLAPNLHLKQTKNTMQQQQKSKTSFFITDILDKKKVDIEEDSEDANNEETNISGMKKSEAIEREHEEMKPQTKQDPLFNFHQQLQHLQHLRHLQLLQHHSFMIQHPAFQFDRGILRLRQQQQNMQNLKLQQLQSQQQHMQQLKLQIQKYQQPSPTSKATKPVSQPQKSPIKRPWHDGNKQEEADDEVIKSDDEIDVDVSSTSNSEDNDSVYNSNLDKNNCNKAGTNNGLVCPLDALLKMTSQTFEKHLDDPDGNESLGHSSTTSGKPVHSNKKRRKSRTAFTNKQIFELEKRFVHQKYLTPVDRDDIAQTLGLTNAQVITWFQNRRAKMKRDLEELKADVIAAKTLVKSGDEDPSVRELNGSEGNVAGSLALVEGLLQCEGLKKKAPLKHPPIKDQNPSSNFQHCSQRFYHQQHFQRQNSAASNEFSIETNHNTWLQQKEKNMQHENERKAKTS